MVTREEAEQKAIKIAKDYEIPAQCIGRVVKEQGIRIRNNQKSSKERWDSYC